MDKLKKTLCIVLLLLVALAAFGCKDDTALAEPATAPVYWNLSRGAELAADTDGTYTLTFLVDGQQVQYTCKDAALAEKISKQVVLGLELEGNTITGMIHMADLPYKWLAWDYYVKSMGGGLVKVNSETGLNGTDALCTLTEQTKVYNVSLLAKTPGEETEVMKNDGVTIVANENDEAVLIFVSDRAAVPDETATYCQHCEKDVIWSSWMSTSQVPAGSGHYRLENDVNVVTSTNIGAASICLDLNGKRIEQTSDGTRIYLQSGTGTLSIMDSVGTGVLRSSNTYMDVASPHKWGMIVSMEHSDAVLNIYAGTLDASGRSVQYGGAINCTRGTINMYGGTILAANPYGTGSGAVRCGGTFNMYDGKIVGGTQQDIGYTSINIHGGAVVRVNGTFNMYGGTIEGGESYTYGGILYTQGIMNLMGGTVTGGKSAVAGSGVYVAAGGQLTLSGDISITGNEGDNVYVSWAGKLIVEDDLKGSVGVSMEVPGEISACGNEKVLEHLHSDDPNYRLVIRNGLLYME